MLPTFCFYCGRIGHPERSCESKMEDSKGNLVREDQYGAWLKVPSIKGNQEGEPQDNRMGRYSKQTRENYGEVRMQKEAREQENSDSRMELVKHRMNVELGLIAGDQIQSISWKQTRLEKIREEDIEGVVGGKNQEEDT